MQSNLKRKEKCGRDRNIENINIEKTEMQCNVDLKSQIFNYFGIYKCYR